MGSLDRPKLRPLPTRRFESGGCSYAAFEDPSGAFPEPVLIPLDGYQRVVRHFDGTASVDEIQARLLRETGRAVGPSEVVELVERLDRAMVLDGPTFQRFRTRYRGESTRTAAFAGRSYAASPAALRDQIDRGFDHPEGAGAPRPGRRQDGPRLRAVLAPHIDFPRGGPVYTWAYRELVERSDADVFVVLGVAHQPCRQRFVLTRKDFETPLGLVRADRAYVDRIARAAGDHLFDDELAHRTEHSIEFQAVWLQHLLGGRREFTIVPVLVGSFHDFMRPGFDPIDDGEVRRFVDALRSAEAGSGKKVAYLGSIDLSHVGPEFGDREPVDRATRDRLRETDGAMLDRAVDGDPAGWFRTAAVAENRSRICGLAATYTLLHAAGPVRGRLLKYDQAVDPRGHCCVSFASVAYDEMTAGHADGAR